MLAKQQERASAAVAALIKEFSGVAIMVDVHDSHRLLGQNAMHAPTMCQVFKGDQFVGARSSG